MRFRDTLVALAVGFCVIIVVMGAFQIALWLNQTAIAALGFRGGGAP